MQIHELANLSGNPASGTSFVVDNGSATRKIDYTALAEALIKNYNFTVGSASTQHTVDMWLDRLRSYYGRRDDAGVHNSIYRGVNIGSSVTSDQFSEISSGSFTNMFIGDYWEIGGYKWRIADFNPYYGKGSPALTTNHIAVIRDESFSPRAWHSIKNTSVGYVGSAIRSSFSEVVGADPTSVEQAFINAFGDSHVLQYTDYYASTYSDGVATAGAFVQCRIELPSEIQVLGYPLHGVNGKQYEVGVGKSQFSLFAHNSAMIGGIARYSYWLRTVADSGNVAYISGTGNITTSSVLADTVRVRPFALIG